MRDAFEGFRSLPVASRRYRVVYRLLGDDRVEVSYIRVTQRSAGSESDPKAMPAPQLGMV